jgi:protease IV
MSEHDLSIENQALPGDKSWERNVIERLALAALTEQQRARRWNIFFKLLLFIYLFIVLFLFLPKDWEKGGISAEKHTALIEIEGVIGYDKQASADNVIAGLRAAFKDPKTRAVILRINSPGGSPVQSGYINDEIFRLRKLHSDIKIYAVITDICASGGYYIASAAHQIYADKASLVGSIGTVMDGFGFVGTLEKLGIERRLWAAGEHKGFLDPFSPLRPEDVSHIHGLLKEVHQQFIDIVKKGRGERLHEDPSLFTGLIWTGEQGLKLGLVDALGSSSHIAREVVHAERIVDFTEREDYLDRLAKRLGTAAARVLTATPVLR